MLDVHHRHALYCDYRANERCWVKRDTGTPVGSVDWLRQVECPSDIADANVGWITAVVCQKYGSGYGLEVKARWMSAIGGNK